MRPTEAQVAVLNMHCGHARFVWNLALEQNQHARTLGQYPKQNLWTRDLAEARGSETWLKAGSSSVQQAALRDLQQAFRNWWTNPNHFRHPKWRVKGRNDGFVIRDLKITANWSQEDRQNLGNATSFGFFDIRDGSLNQNTLEVKGMQIIAWVSRGMPKLPPLSPP